jgi:hypothetical protein
MMSHFNRNKIEIMENKLAGRVIEIFHDMNWLCKNDYLGTVKFQIKI